MIEKMLLHSGSVLAHYLGITCPTAEHSDAGLILLTGPAARDWKNFF